MWANERNRCGPSLAGWSRPLARVGLLLCLTASAGAAQQLMLGTGGVRGVVRDSAGFGISSAEITLRGSALRIQTDEEGRFELAKVPAGPLTLRVRRLGFRPDTVDIMVMAGKIVPFEIVMGRHNVTIAPVVVRGRTALTGWRAGFYSRKELGTGH
ncbi:MAG TPA: carboxypeptidase-like regulatory domain-containing protein, partial [Gemmatimonadaceae bacterium]|nr:carboxypeptidase-like regulatory domain-containing protein [Gemmatimonadaceae bacterium]